MSTFEWDSKILRELGYKVAEIASLPVQQQTIKQWKAINALKPERPMFMMDQLPWHELNGDGELTLHCQDEYCRQLEWGLRTTLYKWNHMRDDNVVEPFIDVAKVITGANFGIKASETVLAQDAANGVVSHHYEDILQEWDDLEKIKMPVVEQDEAETERRLTMAREIFDGVLPVRVIGMGPLGFAPWDAISTWRGVMNPLLDLLERPEFIHAMMERLTIAYLSMLDQLEGKGLLGYNPATVHCSGAWSDQLPAAGFDPEKIRAIDLWTCGMAQMFSTVSPAMHEEFEIEYALRWYRRFGLVYYGCCEPLDRKIGMIRRIANVRKISMSPWADQKRGAEAIGQDFVFSRKPNPAFLAFDDFDNELVKRDLQDTLDICKAQGTPVELILKDVSTIRYQPQRLWQWAQTARELVEN